MDMATLMRLHKRELLSLLSTNEAMVCNTWFEKRDNRKQTWQDPKSKKWHCIGYVLMKKAHRRKCIDASVIRWADYNTNHRMLRANVVVGREENAAYSVTKHWQRKRQSETC